MNTRGKHKAAVELGQLGGLVKSEAKTKAVRENGKKGGRPKKSNPMSEERIK